jgi:hypothetical protein
MKYLFFILAITFISCEDKNVVENETIPYGTYTGKFSRSNIFGKYPQSNVVLTFSSSGFSGESDVVKYPGICNGTYTISGNEIDFSNGCFWTAEFDWSYILNGKFEFIVEGNQLEMVKILILNGNTDRYTLTRQ